MAVATDFQDLTANLQIRKAIDFDPDSADATDVGWFASQDVAAVQAMFIRTVGTGTVDTFAWLGNTAANGGGTDVTIKTKTISSQPDAAMDSAFLEVTEEEIAQAAAAAGVSIKGLSLSLEFGTSTDEGVVVYVVKPNKGYLSLTSDQIA